MRWLPRDLLIALPIYFNLQTFANKAQLGTVNAYMLTTGAKIALSIKLSLPIPHRPVSIARPKQKDVACRSLRQ
jgi:hypothetical protein